MSDKFNFSERYVKESAATLDIGYQSDSEYKREHWREARKLDGAMWDYMGDKRKGLNGELAQLNIRIDINRYSSKEGLQSYIKAAYKDYLEGPDGVNTLIRQSEMGVNTSDEELGDWIVKAPDSFAKKNINQTDFLYWQLANEHRGRDFVYYLLPLADGYFLTFLFHFSISTYSETDRAEQRKTIEDDINKFMQQVLVTKK